MNKRRTHSTPRSIRILARLEMKRLTLKTCVATSPENKLVRSKLKTVEKKIHILTNPPLFAKDK